MQGNMMDGEDRRTGEMEGLMGRHVAAECLVLQGSGMAVTLLIKDLEQLIIYF